MRKYILLLIAAVFLVACGSNEEVETQEETEDVEEELEENNNDEEFSEGPYMDEEDIDEVYGDEYVEGLERTTDDPLEFVEEGKSGLILIDGFNEYVANSYYVTDDTDEDGFNTYKDGDFEMRYAIIETVNIADVEVEGEEELQIFGEIINDTEDDYRFDDGTVLLRTDENETTELSFGFNGAGQADQKSKFIDGFSLEYGIPDSFTLKVLEPTIVDFGEAFEEETGLDEYNNEEELEKFMEEKTVIDKEFIKE